jgi:arylsulfatase
MIKSIKTLGLVVVLAFASTAAAQDKPNILVIWGDDIGVHNISAYNHGVMGYETPSIDRIAKEGALFTDAYAQQSCTAGRASFILGQHPFRTGMLTIGMPGSDPVSLARTTWVIGTSTCRPRTVLTSSTGTCIT